MNDRLSDIDIDSLIAGLTEANSDLGELLAQIRTTTVWNPDSEQQRAHVLEAVAAVSTEVVGTPTVVSSLSPAMTRRQKMFGKIMTNRLTRAMATAMAMLLATSGIAWAATGDDPVKQVTNVVEQVFNGNDDEGDVEGNYEYEADDSDDGPVDDIDDGAVDDSNDGAADQNDESEVDDDDQGNVDQSDESEVDDDDQGDVDQNDESEVDDDDQGNVEDEDESEVDDDDQGNVDNQDESDSDEPGDE